MKNVFGLMVCVVMLLCNNAMSATVSAPVIQDVSILQNTVDDNWDGGSVYVQNTVLGSERRAMLQFDISAVPAGSIIQSVELNVWAGDVDHVVNVHQILTAWDESTVTWGSFNNGGVAGTDFSSDFASTDFNRVAGEYGKIDVKASHVQDWIDGIVANNGLILIQSAGTQQLNIASKEQYGGGYGPFLEITYVPEPATMVMLGLGGLGLLRRKR